MLFKFRWIRNFSLITDDRGIARASNELSNLNAGTWNVTVIFEGDDNYAPCNATATITVLPASSSVTIGDVNTTVGHEVTLVANVNSSLVVNEGLLLSLMVRHKLVNQMYQMELQL